MRNKKPIKRTNKKVNQKKKARIIVSAVIVCVMSLSLMMTIWSSVAGVSPIALAKSWFVAQPEAVQDGINLFDAKPEESELFDGLFVYTPIALEKDAEYVITTHTDKLENFDAEHAHLLIFSNTKFNDLPIDFNIETMFLTKDFEMVFIEMIPTSYKFSAAAYGFDYITLLTIDDLSAEDSSLKIKVEKGTYATAYSDFGEASSEAYHFVDYFADEIAAQFPDPDEEPVKEPDTEEPATVEPTALVVGEQLSGLYVNATAETSDLLNTLVADMDLQTNIIFSQSAETDEEGICKYIYLVNVDDEATLLIAGDFENGFTLLWATAVTDVSDMGIAPYTKIGWQSDNFGNLCETLNISNYYVYRIGDNGGYADWGNGDAEVGKRNIDALFSSTPWE